MMRSGHGSLVVSLSPANSKTESEWYENLVNISTTSTGWHPVHSVTCQLCSKPVSKRPMAHYSRRCAASAPPNATELKWEANKNAGTILTSGTIASNRITDLSRKSCSMTWPSGRNPRCLSSPIPALIFQDWHRWSNTRFTHPHPRLCLRGLPFHTSTSATNVACGTNFIESQPFASSSLASVSCTKFKGLKYKYHFGG